MTRAFMFPRIWVDWEAGGLEAHRHPKLGEDHYSFSGTGCQRQMVVSPSEGLPFAI